MTIPLHPPVTRAADGLPRRRFLVSEIEEMVAAGPHERVKIALTRRWSKAAPEDVEVAQQTTFRLSEDTYLEPDLVLFDRTKGLLGLAGESVFLVVEIADSSLGYDLGRKAALYASFGVRDLWVIDAVKLVTYVFRTPDTDGYRDVRNVEKAKEVTPLVAPNVFELRLADLGID